MTLQLQTFDDTELEFRIADPGNPLDSILCLIAATIMADQQTARSQGRTFLKLAGSLEYIHDMGFDLTEAKLLIWYELNHDKILENLQETRFKEWYFDLLARLSDLPNKNLLLKALQKIFPTQNNDHLNGRALIALTELYWRQN